MTQLVANLGSIETEEKTELHEISTEQQDIPMYQIFKIQQINVFKWKLIHRLQNNSVRYRQKFK